MADIFIAPQSPKQVEAIPFEPALQQTTHPPGIFATFTRNPSQVSFDMQEDNEQVLLFLRRDFITNVPWILSIIILLLIPIVMVTFFRLTTSLLFVPNPGAFALILFLFYYLAVITIGFVYFISWFYNISLVTTIRVLDIEFSGLVYKNVAATKLNLVEDVSFIQVGVIRSVFDYGDVLVQTAGTLDNFDLSAVPQPENVIRIIEDLIGRKKQV